MSNEMVINRSSMPSKLCQGVVNFGGCAAVSSARSCGHTPIISSASRTRSGHAGGRDVRSAGRRNLGRSTTAKGGLRRLRSFVSPMPNSPIKSTVSLQWADLNSLDNEI